MKGKTPDLSMTVAPGGICKIQGPGLIGRKVPSVAADRMGVWVCAWSDAPSVLNGHKPACDAKSADRYRAAVKREKELAAVFKMDPAEIQGFSEEYTPRVYQRRAATIAFNAKRLLLADAVGLGKTLSAWGLRQLVVEKNPAAKMVIVCPSGLRRQWASEIASYSEEQQAVCLPDGPPDKRRLSYKYFMRSDGAVLVVNYEKILVDRVALPAAMKAADILVLDEATRIKNSSTKTAKAIKAASKGVLWKLALTATPLEVAVEDIHSILDWLDPQLLGPMYFFEKLYCVKMTLLGCCSCHKMGMVTGKTATNDRGQKLCRYCGGVMKYLPGRSFTKVASYRNLDHLRARISYRILRRRPSDVGEEMPPVVAQNVWLEFTSEGRTAYEEAAEGCREALKDSRAKLMVATLDAKRACLSPALVGYQERGQKTDAIVEFLTREAADEKALVFTESKQWLVDEFVPALKKAKVPYHVITGDVTDAERHAFRRAFLSDRVRVLVMDAVAEYGLNLPCGLVINADWPWNPASIEQRVGRARRMGTDVTCVRVVNFLMRDSVEEKMLKRLTKRRKLAEVLVGGSDMEPLGMTNKAIAKLL